MGKKIDLEIITPSKVFYKGKVKLVTVRTLSGEEGFMAGHSWAVKLLAVGELRIQESEAKEYKLAAVSGGYIDVKDSIIIFTDTAEWAEDIDMKKAMTRLAFRCAGRDSCTRMPCTPASALSAAMRSSSALSGRLAG